MKIPRVEPGQMAVRRRGSRKKPPKPSSEKQQEYITPEKQSSTAGGGGKRGITPILGVILIVLIVVLGWQVYSGVQKRVVISDLRRQHTDAVTENNELRTELTEITDTIDTIGEKLSDMREKQVAITGIFERAEQGGTRREKLLQDLSVVEEQLEKDKADIADLEERVGKSSQRVRQLQKLVASLRAQLEAHVNRIENLRSIIAAKNVIISEREDELDTTRDHLNTVESDLEQTRTTLQYAESTLDLAQNAAYVLIDYKNNLKENGIITESGIFRKRRALMPDFNQDAFTKIHIGTTKEFTVPSSPGDIELIPARPETSYTLVKSEDSGDVSIITVLDPAEFWKIRHLVIMID